MPAVRVRKTKRVTLTEGTYAGLIVETAGMSFGEFSDKFISGADVDDDAAVRHGWGLVDEFAQVLKWWDMVDENGEPVPANLEGLRTLDLDDVLALVHMWIKAVGDVPDPLDRKSSDGGRFQGASIPVTLPADPSPNLPAWLTQK